MRAYALAMLVTLLLPSGGRSVGAQTLTTTPVTGGTLTVNSAVAGSDPAPVSDGSSTYSVTTRGGRRRITAQLSAAMPAGTTLTMSLVAPPGGVSAGPVALGTAPVDVVTNIPPNTTGLLLGITYTFTSTAAAGVIPTSARTVTLTLLAQ